MKKKFLCIILTVLLSVSVILMSGCVVPSASSYTEEQHIERVSDLVEKRYMTEDSEYTLYKVFPLYDENDKLGFFVVEFEPYGFVYVKINDKDRSKFYRGLPSMYTRSDDAFRAWSRHKTVGDKYVYTELQDNGEPVEYWDSHFKVSDIENERRYLLKVTGGYVPAVRRSEKFLNLISLEEWEYVSLDSGDDEAVNTATPQPADIIFFYKKHFNL